MQFFGELCNVQKAGLTSWSRFTREAQHSLFQAKSLDGASVEGLPARTTMSARIQNGGDLLVGLSLTCLARNRVGDLFQVGQSGEAGDRHAYLSGRSQSP